MPQQKHSTKSHSRAKRAQNRKTKHTKLINLKSTKRNPFKLSKAEDLRRKLTALIENGLYSPKSKRLTKYRKRKINTTFNQIQSRGIIRGAMLVRPFKQTRNGYKLNKSFKVINGKRSARIPNAIKTKTGAIIPRNVASKITVLKDGTLRYKANRLGKNVTVYSGTLNGKQALKFLQQIKNGTFKMPKGKMGRILLFNSDTNNGAFIFDSGESLLNLFAGMYGNGMKGLISRMRHVTKKHPNFGPVTLEFFNAP